MMPDKKLETFIKTLIDFLDDACDEYDADTIEVFSTALAVCVAGIRRVALDETVSKQLSGHLEKLGIDWDPDGLDDIAILDNSRVIDELEDIDDLEIRFPSGAPKDETIH